MRVCNKCLLNKLLDEFSYKSKKLETRQKTCKVCTRKLIQNHYYNNKAYYLEKASKRNKSNKELARKYIWNFLLTNPCVDCGETDPIVLEFDHLKSKEGNVSHMIKDRGSLEKLKKEILKCVVRCANCHRRKTAKDFGWYKYKLPL